MKEIKEIETLHEMQLEQIRTNYKNLERKLKDTLSKVKRNNRTLLEENGRLKKKIKKLEKIVLIYEDNLKL